MSAIVYTQRLLVLPGYSLGVGAAQPCLALQPMDQVLNVLAQLYVLLQRERMTAEGWKLAVVTGHSC